MREALGYKVKSVSDHSHKELSADEVLHIFEDTYLNRASRSTWWKPTLHR